MYGRVSVAVRGAQRRLGVRKLACAFAAKNGSPERTTKQSVIGWSKLLSILYTVRRTVRG